MATDASIHALVITGGHGFEPGPFWEMFDSFEDFSYDTVVFPDAFEYLNVETAKNYDALVFYDMWQEITVDQQAAYLELLKSRQTDCVLASRADFVPRMGGVQPNRRRGLGGRQRDSEAQRPIHHPRSLTPVIQRRKGCRILRLRMRHTAISTLILMCMPFSRPNTRRARR